MDKLDLIYLCSTLYLINYLFHYFIVKGPYNHVHFDLIPFFVLFLTKNLNVIHTDYTILKVALLISLIFQCAFTVSGKRVKRELHLFVNILSSIGVVILFVIRVNLPLVLLNALLIVVGASLLIIHLQIFRITQSKENKNTLEIGFVGFFGVLALGIGNTSFNLIMGLTILLFHKISELYNYGHLYRAIQENLAIRLSDLEMRFDRTVEFEAKKRTAIMADKVEYIREKSQKDPLSKAYNRHGITSEINSLINDSSVKIFSIAIFDIDFFKTINDTKGHVIGDECIKFLSYTFMSNNRKTDVLGRYGGDEFILLMPHINAPAAIEICDRLRKEVFQKSSPKFSISMGIAAYPYDGRTFTELIESADKSMYHAKENGKNRVSYTGNVPLLKK